MLQKFILSLVMSATALAASSHNYGAMGDSLKSYLDTLDARVGVCLIGDGGGFSYRSAESFPMLSVMKFPLALAVAGKTIREGNDFDRILNVSSGQLHSDTYSPMLAKYPAGGNYRITLRELLEYSLKLSDNNACDILIDYLGGIDSLRLITESPGLIIRCSEDDMHRDPMLSYVNTATPGAMAELLRNFDLNADNPLELEIKAMMESCITGENRLSKPLPPTAVIGHKTGSGDLNPQTGRLMAVNDVGYVHLPDGGKFAIAVFVTDSAYPMDETEAIIARVSEMALHALTATVAPMPLR